MNFSSSTSTDIFKCGNTDTQQPELQVPPHAGPTLTGVMETGPDFRGMGKGCPGYQAAACQPHGDWDLFEFLQGQPGQLFPTPWRSEPGPMPPASPGLARGEPGAFSGCCSEAKQGRRSAKLNCS